MKPQLISAIALASFAALPSAQAQTLNTVKFGLIQYVPDSKTSGITGIGVPPGADAEVGSATTLLLTYERTISPNLGVELVLGVPPRVKSKATGTVAFLGDDILSARNVAPTLLLTWHFGEPGDKWRPYVGAGINYTKFTGVRSKLADKVEMSDSVGLAGHAGVDYAINAEWAAFASIGASKVKSDLVASGSTVLKTTIDFRPITYSVGLAYRF
jgi:outer membrane protein